ncbi:SCO family protein [Fodinibius halophilus]|uniref:SCO family protein n=1 Tax=Fodinibius halophilus TaxID=1736908 RepID=A0A6M1T8U2_9BACT|nr:SCO family protein [Fodinibius halophilus]NGP87504.1 hypothetical protein [Fodinibius halophilus]
MGKVISLFLLASLLLLPATLVIGFSYLGNAHPLENKTVAEPPFLSQSSNSIEVLFFGYVGCESICPTSLIKLAKVFKEIDQKYPDSKTGAVFVDIGEQVSADLSNRYSRQFSEDIRGVTLAKDDMKQVLRDFNVRLNKPNADKPTIFHTDHFFVLQQKQNEWKVRRVLSNNIEKEAIQLVLEQAIQ